MKKENDEIINKDSNIEMLDDNEILSEENIDEEITNEPEENNDENSKEEELKEQIETYEEIQEYDRRQKVILVIIIIILLLLLLLWLTWTRIGKIGNYIETSWIEIGGNIEEISDLKLIEVRDEDVDITKNTEIDIFENEKFNFESIIAPRSSGTYQFCVKNIANKDITYDINFTDEMDLPVNMKYKLKIDNIYIRGNENSYININKLNVKDIIVVKDSINLFTLEWYWEDDDRNDTIVGRQKEDQHYILNVQIRAEEYNKKR